MATMEELQSAADKLIDLFDDRFPEADWDIRIADDGEYSWLVVYLERQEIPESLPNSIDGKVGVLYLLDS